MTNKETIIKAITLLKTNYQNSLKDYSKQEVQMMINAWLEFFKETPEQDFNKAIRNIINKYDYFPTISQIKKEIANNQTSDIPKAEDEWEEVLRMIHRYGTYRQQEALDNMKPYTAYIVNHIGYQIICLSTDNTWNRKEFIEEYNQLKEREKELIQIGSEETKLFTNNKLLGSTEV
jgi:hypothetical protein